MVRVLGFCFLIVAIHGACGASRSIQGRMDGARPIDIPLDGSLQNPAWSPNGELLLFTRFRDGYNLGPADLFIYDFETETVRPLVMEGHANVNLPGSAWSAVADFITFSSDRGQHDEIYLMQPDSVQGNEIQLTRRIDQMAYEPSFSPDGLQVVFESHPLEVEGQGVITIFALDGSGGYRPITPSSADCRQPNWAATGDMVYQCLDQGRWDLWVNGQQVTFGTGDKTDASFSSDGQWIVYSSDQNEMEHANLFALSIDGGQARRLTYHDGYDGAPSWSPTGNQIAFEACSGDPDESGATTLWIIDLSKWIFSTNKMP